MKTFKNYQDYQTRKSELQERILESEMYLQNVKEEIKEDLNPFMAIRNFISNAKPTSKKIGSHLLVNKLLPKSAGPLVHTIAPLITNGVINQLSQPQNKYNMLEGLKAFLNRVIQVSELSLREEAFLQAAELENQIEEEISKVKEPYSTEIEKKVTSKPIQEINQVDWY